MSDSSLIHNLFAETEPLDPFDQFTETQWQWLQDYNNGNYSGGQIKFDTLSLKSQWVDYRSAYLAVPITLAPDGQGTLNTWAITADTLTSVTQVVVKNSICSLIQSMVINTGSGQNIINEFNSPQLINNIRLMVENSIDWTNSEGAEYMFAPDTNLSSNNVTSIATLPMCSAVQNQIIASLANNSATNKGWAKRFGYILQQSGSSVTSNLAATGLSFTAILPLRLLHDFFEQLDFPMINLRFQMNFYMANQINGVSTPASASLQGGYPFATMASAAGYSNPYAYIGGGNGSCRLYYKTVKYTDVVGAQIAERMAQGFTKTVKYITTDYTTLATAVSAAALTTSVQVPSFIISAGTVRPLRVWCLLPSATQLLGTPALNTTITPATNNCVDPNVWPIVCTGRLINSNILINGTNYFNNNIAGNNGNTDYEWWQFLKEQLPGYGETNTLGGTLSYYDWQTSYRFYCFDISRAKDRIKAPNDAVTIQLQSNAINVNTSGNGGNTLICLTERQQIVKIRLSSSDVEVLVGINAY